MSDSYLRKGLLYPGVLSEILRRREPADWEPPESPLKGAETTLPGQGLPLNAYYQGADWPGKIVDPDPPNFARRSKRLQQAADNVKSTNQG
ncbi:unnamed protein product [Aureobasidium pullulans]|nr:unnamed protein product [Aureobasidium pullulans]